jgi:pimeloyl-ACP methyl ester carboxylesterase
VVASEIRIRANGMELAAKQWGSADAPAVIALHGWLDNAASFDRLAPMLPGYRIIALDLAGHGYSTHRPEGVRYNALDNVDDVVALADALDLERFILLAHSWGAGIATYTAGIFPERVSELILVEGIGGYTSRPHEAPSILRKAVEDLKNADTKRKPLYATRDEAIRARAQAHAGISMDAAARLCTRGLEPVHGGFTWRSDPRLRMSSVIRPTEEMVTAFLRRLSMPVLLVLGRLGLLAEDPTLQVRAHQIPDCRSMVLDGNHHLHLELDTCSAVADAITAFLCDSCRRSRGAMKGSH